MKLLRTTLWATTIGYWVFLCVITHIPQVRLPRVPVTDKTAHLVAYFVLSGLLSVAWWLSYPRDRFAWVWVLAILMSYAAADEITQEWVGRYKEFTDWIADSVGAAVAVGVVGIVRMAVERRRATALSGTTGQD
jgi:VanZ family protein